MSSLAIALLLSPAVSSTFQAVKSAIPNSSFERVGPKDTPEGWTTRTWAGGAKFGVADFGRIGSHCVFIESGAGVDGGWQVEVGVKPYSRYRLTAWIRTENVLAEGNRGALINLHARSEHTTPLKGTNGWTKVSLGVDTGSDDVLLVNCLMGYFGQAKGKAWFDDLTLELLSTRELKSSVTVDVSKTREAISPYIYSQFIEHMGRCIYGGIWAEMLEDRKFLYSIGSQESPWQKFGDEVPTTLHPSSFRAQPVVNMKGKIRQSKLQLVSGMEYMVRVTYAGGKIECGIESDGWAASKVLDDARTFTTSTFKLRAAKSTANAAFFISGLEPVSLAAVSLMPADSVRGMRRDTLRLLKELNAPLYRWPGGNFVSGYNWRDGIGERDRRPTRKNPAWQGIESNDFGIHEFMDFCKEVGAEPLVVVNTGLGSVDSAVEEVEYINGPADSPMGKLRAANGRKEPWKVNWWGVGNEMYGDWQLGHIPLPQYTRRHNEFATAMRTKDPTIKLVAVGENYGAWTRGMFENCAWNMDLISEHFYCQDMPGVMGHSAQIADQIRRKVSNHRQLQQEIPAARRIKIAMDEWNYWYGPHVFGELGTRYYWKDGLGIARGLHEFFRSTDAVYMANYAQTVNVIGAIKTNPVAAEMETTGLVLALYRKHFGAVPVEVSGSSEPLDVSAALTAGGKHFTLAVVNPTADRLTLKVSKPILTNDSTGRKWTIAHADPMAFNEPGKPRTVKIVETAAGKLGRLLVAEPYSVTLLRYPMQPR